MIKTITAVPVERDSNGFWTHPDFFVPANGNEFGVEGEFYAWKALNRVTGAMGWMEDEENAEELQAEYDSINFSVSKWNPTPPYGDGWFMVSIHETDDGPVCYWLRPIELDPEALAAHFNNCYAEAFKTEYLVADRDSALNTCTLIAEALGITGAVAGDTIAKVQQLVAENAALKNSYANYLTEQNLQAAPNVSPEAAFNHCVKWVDVMCPTPTTTQALNEIKAQGVDEFADNWQGKESHSQISEMARRFAASLRGEQNAK
ncbi:hypothetical protein [Yersinia mollaretii]|uniref:hypothetical protein n=1 Tax=Yersinia mollaretii TaxID=33060 RepID=UPI0025AAB56E|nr:hypothetical protein [Yersinia mollaretii]MDN0109418.1 hypothetical protein [Yersinia mollaretii]